eukprot:8231895-Pyramimonas_sp.AAC.1
MALLDLSSDDPPPSFGVQEPRENLVEPHLLLRGALDAQAPLGHLEAFEVLARALEDLRRATGSVL